MARHYAAWHGKAREAAGRQAGQWSGVATVTSRVTSRVTHLHVEVVGVLLHFLELDVRRRLRGDLLLLCLFAEGISSSSAEGWGVCSVLRRRDRRQVTSHYTCCVRQHVGKLPDVHEKRKATRLAGHDMKGTRARQGGSFDCDTAEADAEATTASLRAMQQPPKTAAANAASSVQCARSENWSPETICHFGESLHWRLRIPPSLVSPGATHANNAKFLEGPRALSPPLDQNKSAGEFRQS